MTTKLVFYHPELNRDVFFTDPNDWTIGTSWSVGNDNDPGAIKIATGAGNLSMYDSQLKPEKLYKWTLSVDYHTSTVGNDMYLQIGGVNVQLITPSFTPLLYSGISSTTSNVSVVFTGPAPAAVKINYLKIVEYPEDMSIDVTDDIDIPMTYSIADIKDPSKRNGFSSRTVTIPGTKENSKYFGHIFEISADCTYNPNKKASAYIVSGGIEQFRGFVKLDNINRVNNGLDNYDLVSYDLTLIGGMVDPFYLLGDTLLTDLDFSEYDHEYNRTNQRASWHSYIYKNGVPYNNFTNGPNLTISSVQMHASGRVQVNFSSAHGLVKFDWLLIPESSILTGDAYYAGEHMVLQVVSSTSVVLQCAFEPLTGTAFTTNNTVKKHTKSGEGYVYTMIDFDQNNDVYWDMTQLYPAIYAKTIVDKMFKKIKFTVESDFMDSVMYKKLVVPYTNGNLKLSADTIAARLFKASNIDTANPGNWPAPLAQVQTFVLSNAGGPYTCHQILSNPAPTPIDIVIDNDSTSGNFDNGSTFNTSTYRWTCPANGLYSFASNVYVYWCWEYISGVTQAWINNTGTTGVLQVEVFDYTTNTVVPMATDIHGPVTNNSISVFPNSTMLVDGEAIKLCKINADNLLLTAGNQYGIRVRVTTMPALEFYSPGITPYAGDVTINYGVYSQAEFFNTIKNTNIQPGDDISINDIIPQKLKCVDFLKSIINMFNLYVDISRDNDRKLIIEPRDDFYANGIDLDWTQKLDTDQPLVISPMTELHAKKYEYKYKSDKDFYNADHERTWGTIYGNKSFQVDNDFVKETNTTELIFSPTIITNSTGPLNPVSRLDMRLISNMQSGTTTDASTQPFAGNTRILFFNCASDRTGWYHAENQPLVNGTYGKMYPYAGHLDKPHLPYSDLNFDYPRGVYFTDYAWTDRNLFNLYYRRMIEEITDKDSKVVKAYMHLTAKDIFMLDFRNRIQIDNHWFRLNRVQDFVIGKNIPVLCEFLLVKDKPGFVSTITESWPVDIDPPGGDPQGRAFNSPIPPVYAGESNSSNKGMNAGTVILQGIGNIATGTEKVFVNGDYNSIGPGSSSVIIDNGSNNTVMPGLNNVNIINTSGKTVTESGVTYVNGVYISPGGVFVNDSINLLDAGENRVLNMFGSSSLVNNIDAVEDAVFKLGTKSPANNIDASENKTTG